MMRNDRDNFHEFTAIRYSSKPILRMERIWELVNRDELIADPKWEGLKAERRGIELDPHKGNGDHTLGYKTLAETL